MYKPGQKTAMISSTAIDLPKHRREAIAACLRLNFFPLAMEYLPASDADAIRISTELVDRADIYIGIFAWRYGYKPEHHDISITEIEFKRAVRRKIPILVFLIHREHALTIDMVETDAELRTKLAALKDLAADGRVRREFRSPEDLRGEIIHALSDLQQRQETTSDEIALPHLHPLSIIPELPEPYIAHPYSLLQTKDVVGRQAELNLLTDWVTTNKIVPAETRIFNIVAIGGMGKSALTWKWFNVIAPNEMPNLAGGIWWSFYESDAHWENFIVRALAYVSGQAEESVRAMKPPDREEQLWRILDERPFLVVLDGLERILLAYARMDAARLPDEDLDERTANAISEAQDLPIATKNYAEKHRLRQCSDMRAGRMLRRLAQLRKSLVLISSRLYPAELQTETGKLLPGCYAKFLTGLPDDDALNLWRAFGVTGSREQLLPIFGAFGNYPLLLRALAGEVADFRPAPGNFDQWLVENRGFKPTELSLKNARTHVLRFALRGLGETQRHVLSTLAAFRMPAAWETLRDVIVGDGTSYPVDDGTPGSAPLTYAGLDLALAELEDRGLIGWDKTSNRYDLHPIVRLVAWDRTSKKNQTLILERLHQYFRVQSTGPDRAKLSRLEDITAAVEYYCTLIALGRYKEAFSAFRRSLDEPTLYVFGAIRLRIELLEMLFPHGNSETSSLPSENKSLTRKLAFSYYLLGEPGRSLQMTIHRSPNRSAEDWKLQYFSATSIGRLYAAELALAKTLTTHTSNMMDPVAAVMSCLPWFMYSFATRGIFVTSERTESYLEAQSLAKLPRKKILIWLVKAQRFLWNNQPQEALAAINRVSDLVPQIDRQRERIRLNRLYGAAYLAIGNLGTAADHLQKSLLESRAVNLVEEELRTLAYLADLYRQRKEYERAEELLADVWAPAERGPYPIYHADALNVLTRIQREQGRRNAAIASALQAYELSWCDGPPYAYHHGVSNARQHLRELDVREPRLKAFDASKFEPMPDFTLEPDLSGYEQDLNTH